MDRDLVPEMVFLLGRMGNNKKALNLIIERLGDVNRVSLPRFLSRLTCILPVFPGHRFCQGTK